jgi:PilZ domain-containing protein
MELRKRVRYRLAANAVFAWESAQSSRLLGQGVTRDISLAGVFIFTSTSPPVGTAVQLEIFLPPLLRGTQGARIKTEATVIRIEHSGGAEGFAVVGHGFSLFSGETQET